MENKWNPNCVCPICEQHKFEEAYDICDVCFWENDNVQYDQPDFKGGANILCLNDYKKWWNKLNKILPILMKKYNIKNSILAHWKFDEMIVPREYIKDFVNELTNNNIKIRLSFYHLCEKYGYDNMDFVGFVFTNDKTIAGSNNESIDFIYTNNPIEACKHYKLKQVLEILEKSKDLQKAWEEMTAYVSIEPNPREV